MMDDGRETQGQCIMSKSANVCDPMPDVLDVLRYNSILGGIVT